MTTHAARAAHIQRILTQFHADARAKYAAGQREHGGNLWEQPGLLDRAIEEAIDLVIYLYTLREQQAAAPRRVRRGARRSARRG